MVGRSDQNGPQGGGVNKEVAFTLNATDHHAVYAASTGNFSSAFLHCWHGTTKTPVSFPAVMRFAD